MPSQQFNGSHFAHVHANGIRGSAKFAFHGRREHGLSFFNDFFVIAICGFQQQGICIGSRVVDLNAEVIDHVYNGLNLIGVVHVLRQMVIDFAIGKEALFLAFNDQLLKFGLLALGIDRHKGPLKREWERNTAENRSSIPRRRFNLAFFIGFLVYSP